ncbi:MAG: universal stress protein [Alphaproteobacteria bacterium]
MRELKRIVVGHDLRGGGEAALKSAAVLAKRYGAALRLVHVVEPPHSYERIAHPMASSSAVEEVAQKIGAKLEALTVSPDLAGLQVEYEVRRGKPFVELIIARRAWSADLLVVGNARETVAHLLGSTSERVVRKAMVPVMVVKKVLSANAQTFLVPTDFSACAKKAAAEALVLAKNFSGRVVFVHVVDLYPSYAFTYTDDIAAPIALPPPPPEEIEAEWQGFLSGLPLDKVAWEKNTQEGEPPVEILQQAEQKKADLIVMGTHGRTGLEYMLMGSVAEKVVRAASFPVLTIRPEAFQFALP